MYKLFWHNREFTKKLIIIREYLSILYTIVFDHTFQSLKKNSVGQLVHHDQRFFQDRRSVSLPVTKHSSNNDLPTRTSFLTVNNPIKCKQFTYQFDSHKTTTWSSRLQDAMWWRSLLLISQSQTVQNKKKCKTDALSR